MSKEVNQALQIAIDYMNDRLEDHDCKYQRHPATEAERINILADIETVKEALAKQEGQSNFCPQCEALARELKASKQEQGEPVAIPEGFSLVAVKGFDELMYWLDRCESKGHLEKCPDLIEPYEAFDYRTIDTTPQQRKPLMDEQIEAIWDADTTSADDCQSLYYAKVIARAIEAAHGITK